MRCWGQQIERHLSLSRNADAMSEDGRAGHIGHAGRVYTVGMKTVWAGRAFHMRVKVGAPEDRA